MNFRSIILSFAAMILFSGCASLGPSFTPLQASPSGKSIVYIYRVSHFAGSAYSPDVKLDGKTLGTLSNGSYLPFEVAPGQHKIELESIAGVVCAIDFKLSDKAEHYLRFDTTMNNGAKESATNAQSAALGPGGGGAIGAAMTSGFFASKDEKDTALKAADSDIAQPLSNPGLFFVKPDFAKPEISKTKLGH